MKSICEIKKSFIVKVIPGPERRRSVCRIEKWRKGIPGRGNNMCKFTEAQKPKPVRGIQIQRY